MDKIIELAQELKSELDNLPLFQEYQRIKELLETSSEIEELKKNIALAKLHEDTKLHQSLLDQYHNHPLMVNYEELKNEVYDYLKQISDIVNKK